MNSTLVIFFLSVQSSYAENTEADATEDAFDTVQFYESERGSWRIKTYAVDQDVHAWSWVTKSKTSSLAHARTLRSTMETSSQRDTSCERMPELTGCAESSPREGCPSILKLQIPDFYSGRPKAVTTERSQSQWNEYSWWKKQNCRSTIDRRIESTHSARY